MLFVISLIKSILRKLASCYIFLIYFAHIPTTIDFACTRQDRIKNKCIREKVRIAPIVEKNGRRMFREDH